MTKIRLQRAWLKGARKTYGFKPRRRGGHMASQHAVGAARFVHVAPDVVVVTDGSWGYMPFQISTLRTLLDEVEAAPIESEFKVYSR